MKCLILVLALAAVALAGPTSNQVTSKPAPSTPTTDLLKQWCSASQKSQPELTAAFKKLIQTVKSTQDEAATDAAVLGGYLCSEQQQEDGAASHGLVKDVYMDALLACDSNTCMQRLIKIVKTDQVDAIRSAYYMTRIAISDKTTKSEEDTKAFAEMFTTDSHQHTSEATNRQHMFAATALIQKGLKQQPASSSLKQVAAQVAKSITDRYIKPVSQQEVQQYLKQSGSQQQPEMAKKIAQRSAALKALANLPAYTWVEVADVKETILSIASNKQEMSTVRQSAIECLEQSDAAKEELKKICFDQSEPTEVRVVALRVLMTSSKKQDSNSKTGPASQIVEELVKYCDQPANQQQDDQFVFYTISYLDNLCTSQEKDIISKQAYMKIQLLTKKFKKQLSDVRNSHNYHLHQNVAQLDTDFAFDADVVYESQHKEQQKQHFVPKLMRLNVTLPDSANIVEFSVRQANMDEELLSALKMVSSTKLNSESITKTVGSFKSSLEKQQQPEQQQSAEADLCIKVDGYTVAYVSADDFKSATSTTASKRSTRSTNNIVDELIQHLKQNPINFNRGFNVAINERIAKVFDIDANLLAGLRFVSKVSGSSQDNFEIVVKAEPRFAVEAIVGPAKLSSKKLLQRFSTNTAFGLRLRFKSDELVDLQIDLPMDDMELFKYESQMVEKKTSISSYTGSQAYSYMPESIYGDQDIYSYDSSYDNIASYKVKRSLLSKNKREKAFTYETSEELARATGLRSKLRVVASPKDMSFFAQASASKTESSMQGYRMQIKKDERSAGQQQYEITISTPGSRQDRTVQLRVAKQTNAGRTVLKTEVQSPKLAAEMQAEIVHDGRQYSVKVQLASTRGKQWRHAFECGVQRGSQQSGRVATTYKPYLNIQSSKLQRPIQMQGAVSYQTTPKSVITYEVRCPTTGDYVQGKIILHSRNAAYGSSRRSMRSPLEAIFQKDLTFTHETTAQIKDHSYKSQRMLDWDASKQALNVDYSAVYKNSRKSSDAQISASLKLDQESQVLRVQRKCQDSRKSFDLVVASHKKSQIGVAHQMTAELRYNGKRSTADNLQSLVAYKHQVELQKTSRKSAKLSYTIELTATELKFQEKLSGSAQVGFDGKLKTLSIDMSSRNKSAKMDVQFESLSQHQIELVLQSERLSHRTNVHADKRQFSLQSRTDSRNKNIAKVVVEVQKQQAEAQLVIELPTKAVHYAADLKLASGKTSSVAVQTPRFSSNVQFTFDTAKRAFNANKRVPSWAKPYLAARNFESLRFKTDLKDRMNQQAYWLDSALDTRGKSYLSFDSPIYRSDLAYEPEQNQAKFGLFARQKRSISAYNSPLYSAEDSLLNQPMDYSIGGDKLWMIRSMISSSAQLNQAKQAALRALFEFADRRASNKHSINWSPIEDRLNLDYHRKPTDAYKAAIKPLRFAADFAPKSFYGSRRHNQQQVASRPSTISFDSDFADVDFQMQPYNGEESYAKLSANSRYPRSAKFSKHESEIRYSKKHGYKGQAKHYDADNKRHSIDFEAEKSPMKYAKMHFDSDKYGKTAYEHNWRKEAKRADDKEYYGNYMSLSSQSPATKDWSHSSKLSWNEPIFRERRSISQYEDELALVASDADRLYSTIDYLKRVNANMNSVISRDGQQYQVDFDYKPKSHARLNVDMPGDQLHSSAVEYQPIENAYKLYSKLINKRTQVPSYELQASTIPMVAELATANQEPVFIDSQPMLERPISHRIAANLVKQPIKLAYSDKYGRVANFDYDYSPLSESAAIAAAARYAGLRQKRAAVYYKDDDFQHQSSFDFYPTLAMKQRRAGDYAIKSETKYGPIVLSANSDDRSTKLNIKSPAINAKMTIEEAAGKTLTRLSVDNKDQRVRLAKIVRNQLPAALRNLEIVQDIVNKIDQSRFEHETEIISSSYGANIKSQTYLDRRPVLTIDGQLDKKQEKLVVKISGERADGQLIADLYNNFVDFEMNVDGKRTFDHKTRLVRTSDKFYTLECVTSYKQQPLLKLSGKVSAMVFSPEHLLSRSSSDEHISSFEAMLYGQRPIQVSGQYDCLKKEARFVFEDSYNKKVQISTIKYQPSTNSVLVDARLNSPYGQIYNTQAKLNLPGLVKSNKCRSAESCSSELNYVAKSGSYSARYLPGKYVAINTPRGSQTVRVY